MHGISMKFYESGLCPFIRILRKNSRNLLIFRVNKSSLQTFAATDYEKEQLFARKYDDFQTFKKKNSSGEKKQILHQIESIAAQKILSCDKERLAELEERAKILFKDELEERNEQTKSVVFPYNIEQNPKLFSDHRTENAHGNENKWEENAEEQRDVGFFVADNKFCDDYASASTADLPESEMTEPGISFYGNVDEAVENIEFQLPMQTTIPRKGEQLEEEKEEKRRVLESGEWLGNYATTEVPEEQLAQLKIADEKCASCGANFHCHNASLPGFVPIELMKEIKKNSKKIPFHQKTDFVCRRCFLLKEFNFLLNVNVCEVDYAKMMGYLKLRQEALILMIVDMTDLNASIHRELPSIIGPKKPLIVVGNKADLLPPDTRNGYLRHYMDCLKQAISEAGISENFNILKYMLVSAKTGFGIEEMITNIYQNWIGPRGVLRGDIYVVGATNAGKSTLFNTMIQSDLCKVRAMDLVERVTTSIWPGTTLSLLKFPLMNPTPQRLEMRRKRLISMQAWRKKEEYVRRAFYEKTHDPKYVALQGIVENTFKDIEEDLQPVSTHKLIEQFNGEFDGSLAEQLDGAKKGPNMTLNDRVFQRGSWCFDTPGAVNKQQVLDLFTLEELINVIPRSIVLPRIFIVRPGDSLLLGAVARVDLLEASCLSSKRNFFLFTVFASKSLKVTVMKTALVNEWLEKHRGDSPLGAPIGDAERLSRFPKLDSSDFTIENQHHLKTDEHGIADVVLSSLGWVLLTMNAKSAKIRAWTPSARGLLLRQPPLLPYAAAYRGKRIPGSAGFETLKLAEVETFSQIQRSSRPGRVVTKNFEISEACDDPFRFVNFDLA